MDESRPAKQEERKAREARLQLAIANDNLDELHNLIVEEPQLLDRRSKDPFPNTPLHIAATTGKTNVAREMAILKPSFSRKLNPEGYSPMHLALQHQHYHTVRALKIFDPKLIRVQGRCGITPLHYIAEKEEDTELELLAEFLFACKSSIRDLTSRDETAVHVAVRSHNYEAFKVLFGWLKRVNLTHILKWKDQDGNTVLHIAASGKLPEIIKLLIEHTDVNAKNLEGKTALDILEENPCDDQDVVKRLRRQRRSTPSALSLSRFFSQELTSMEKHEFFFGFGDKTARDIILVVATLIATATYQAALSPPGGYWQETSPSSNPSANSAVSTANSSGVAVEKPHQAGDIIMKGPHLYVFSIVNSLAFFASISTIWAVTLPVWPHTSMVYTSMVILGTAFSYRLVSQFPKSERVPGLLLGSLYMLLLVAAFVVPIIVWKEYARIVKRIDTPGRPVDSLLVSKGRK